MVNKKRILISDIRHACGDTYFSRGKRYFEEDRVLDFSTQNETFFSITLKSTIEGSRGKSYKQHIKINWKKGYDSASINGDCTCPMYHNCKHIVATCLEYMDETGTTPHPEQKTHACLDWLSNFDELQPTTTDKKIDFIAYILQANKENHTFTLDFVITREGKNGSINKGRKISLNNLRFSYSYESHIQEIDIEIARILYSMDITYQGSPQLAGSTGYIVLSKVIQTGRLFYQSAQTPAIQPGNERELQFVWQQQNDHYTLTQKITPDAKLILTDPPLYLDSEHNTLGAIKDLNLSHTQLSKITAAPQIPEEFVDEFSQRLTIEHPSIPLPSPKEVELTEISGFSPTPLITLSGSQVNDTQYVHHIKLNFIYDNKSISANKIEPFSIVKEDHIIFRIQREIDNEQNLINQLLELGFKKEKTIGNTELILFSPGETSIMDSAARWADFIENTLPQLEKQGWLVNIDNNFKLNFQQADDWHADIEETGNDWFEMNFQVNINGQPMALLPLIMPVLEHYTLDTLPDTLSVPIEDHTYITLPSSKLKPFLEIVYELFDSSTMNENGSLTLSRFNAASLADLEAHSYGVFSLKGGKSLIEIGKKLRDFTGIEEATVPSGLSGSLREYQQQGLNWLQFLREYNFAGILADDMGLGKTIQTLSHLLLEKQMGRMEHPCLIVAPTSLMGNWRREAKKFTPDLNVLTLQGAERKQYFSEIKNNDLILTTYPLLHRDKEALMSVDYHYMILDEAQVIKNPRSQAAQIVREIKTNHRLCLTGTPMENHLGELWAQFDFLMPGFLGNNAFFKKTYRTPIEVHGDQQQGERLSTRLKPFMLRRTKQDVATELPPKTVIIRSVPLHDKQAVLYESIRISMEKKVRDAIADKGLARSHITILDALLKLRQTCCDPRILALKKAQKVKESAKLDLLMEMLTEQLEEGRRILVFSQFTKMIALMEKELNTREIQYSKLTGQTRKRDEAIDRFKCGDADVFLISLKAGGVGLNLTEADTVIIYDPWWNPAVEMQAADRAHRIGQEKPVFVYKLMAENTVEEKILAMQEKKRALADSIYKDGKKDQSAQFTSEDLTELFKPLS